MTGVSDAEKRIKVLEEEIEKLRDIETIKNLKYRYWRCVDNRLWDELADCFTEDASVDYGFGIQLNGRRAIKKFFIMIVGQRFSESMHQGHNPEIEVTGKSARGRWQIDQFGIESKTGKAVRIGGIYVDEYVKDGDGWRIKKSTKERYNYRYTLDMEEFE